METSQEPEPSPKFSIKSTSPTCLLDQHSIDKINATTSVGRALSIHAPHTVYATFSGDQVQHHPPASALLDPEQSSIDSPSSSEGSPGRQSKKRSKGESVRFGSQQITHHFIPSPRGNQGNSRAFKSDSAPLSLASYEPGTNTLLDIHARTSAADFDDEGGVSRRTSNMSTRSGTFHELVGIYAGGRGDEDGGISRRASNMATRAGTLDELLPDEPAGRVGAVPRHASSALGRSGTFEVIALDEDEDGMISRRASNVHGRAGAFNELVDDPQDDLHDGLPSEGAAIRLADFHGGWGRDEDMPAVLNGSDDDSETAFSGAVSRRASNMHQAAGAFNDIVDDDDDDGGVSRRASNMHHAAGAFNDIVDDDDGAVSRRASNMHHAAGAFNDIIDDDAPAFDVPSSGSNDVEASDDNEGSPTRHPFAAADHQQSLISTWRAGRISASLLQIPEVESPPMDVEMSMRGLAGPSAQFSNAGGSPEPSSGELQFCPVPDIAPTPQPWNAGAPTPSSKNSEGSITPDRWEKFAPPGGMMLSDLVNTPDEKELGPVADPSQRLHTLMAAAPLSLTVRSTEPPGIFNYDDCYRQLVHPHAEEAAPQAEEGSFDAECARHFSQTVAPSHRIDTTLSLESSASHYMDTINIDTARQVQDDADSADFEAELERHFSQSPSAMSSKASAYYQQMLAGPQGPAAISTQRQAGGDADSHVHADGKALAIKTPRSLQPVQSVEQEILSHVKSILAIAHNLTVNPGPSPNKITTSTATTAAPPPQASAAHLNETSSLDSMGSGALQQTLSGTPLYCKTPHESLAVFSKPADAQRGGVQRQLSCKTPKKVLAVFGSPGQLTEQKQAAQKHSASPPVKPFGALAQQPPQPKGSRERPADSGISSITIKPYSPNELA